MDEQLRFIADEGVGKEIVLALRRTFDVLYVVETMRSASDDIILKRAEEEDRILITLDKDFGELVYRLQHHHAA